MTLQRRNEGWRGQRPAELERLVTILVEEGVTRYLEIGTRHGDTFYSVMMALPPGSTGVAVDLPGSVWGLPESRLDLDRCLAELRDAGRDVHVIYGDSTDPETVAQVAAMGPFCAVFIDGDHRYPGVLQDWENYGPLARLVAFHDIDGDGAGREGMPVEVPRLWREIRGFYRHEEIIDPNVRQMGIGVLWH